MAAVKEIGDGLCEEFAELVLSQILQHYPEAERDIGLGYTDDWWIRALDESGCDTGSALAFEADIDRLRTEGAPIPADITDAELSLLIGSATHVWLRWNGLHFDATAPDGSEHFLLMPFFRDQIAGYRADTSNIFA
ncbi:hypothetical protein [Sphingomonas sp. 3-13AW]|uniref:hypothetical protein n=1 Tax=Sphingomonas sp. 3-13AW TaxID=3050450 RepID=UPI003BB6A799